MCPCQFKIFHVSPYQCIALCKSAETAPRAHEFSTSFHMCVDRKASMPNGRNEREHSVENVKRPGFPLAIGTPWGVSHKILPPLSSVKRATEGAYVLPVLPDAQMVCGRTEHGSPRTQSYVTCRALTCHSVKNSYCCSSSRTEQMAPR